MIKMLWLHFWIRKFISSNNSLFLSQTKIKQKSEMLFREEKYFLCSVIKVKSNSLKKDNEKMYTPNV